jgi:hypothetical protein
VTGTVRIVRAGRAGPGAALMSDMDMAEAERRDLAALLATLSPGQ